MKTEPTEALKFLYSVEDPTDNIPMRLTPKDKADHVCRLAFTEGQSNPNRSGKGGGMSDERKLEIDCCTYARQKGIIAVKLEKNAHKGIPDYMFIAEGGVTMFVEFKRPDGKGVVSDEQKYWAEFLGYSHKFIDNFEEFKEELAWFFYLVEDDVLR